MMTPQSVSNAIAAVEAKPSWAERFSPTRYPYTYAYDYLRAHAEYFGLPSNMSREQCSGLLYSNPDKEAICRLLADAYLREWGIKKPETTNDVSEATEPDYRGLAEKLMSELAFLRNTYETATCNHPDDDERVLTLDHTRAVIENAFRIIYGREMEE